MNRTRKLAIVFATVAVAAGSGHVMQSGRGAEAAVAAMGTVAPTSVQPLRGAPAADPAATAPVALAEVAVPTVAPALAATVAAVPGAPPPAAAPAVPPLELAALTGPSGGSLPQPDAVPPVVAGPRDCTPRLTLLPAPAAMIDVILSAPCDGDARVVIRHAGLALTGRTGPDGSLVLALPALAEVAAVTVSLPGGAVAEAALEVPALAAWDRVAVQWQAPDVFQLHAFEGGAAYGARGHVYAGAPQGETGFLTLLGEGAVDRPMLAEVYSLRRGALEEGVVRVTVEAPITAATCGRDLLAELVEMRAGKPALAVELTLAAPDCAAAGDYLVMPWEPGAARLAGN